MGFVSDETFGGVSGGDGSEAIRRHDRLAGTSRMRRHGSPPSVASVGGVDRC